MNLFALFHKKFKRNSKLDVFYKTNELIVLREDGSRIRNPKGGFKYISIDSNDSYNNRIIIKETQKNQSPIKCIFYRANNNEIVIGKNNEINIDICVQGNNGKCHIGDNNYIGSAILYFYCSGKTTFTIGNNNLFSEKIVFWAGEGHSMLDSKTKKITNLGGSISIGDNNWICMNTCFLKRAKIGNGCVVGYGSIVCNDLSKEDKCVVAGNPAVIVKHDVLWSEQTPWTFDGCLYRNKDI